MSSIASSKLLHRIKIEPYKVLASLDVRVFDTLGLIILFISRCVILSFKTKTKPRSFSGLPVRDYLAKYSPGAPPLLTCSGCLGLTEVTSLVGLGKGLPSTCLIAFVNVHLSSM